LGGSLRLVGKDERVLKVFSITGLDKVFEIHPTLDEALAASEAEATTSEAGQGETVRTEAAGARVDAEGARAASSAKSSDSGA
ncbi:MAG TPA: hypothetical protein VFM07_11350, partial [Intrasporangium sp.]|nr:hypothetical protein [Intrasporangium sp.]